MSEILGIIQLIAWVVTVAGLYFKMKNDISLASQASKTDNEAVCLSVKIESARIDKIEKDRDVRRREYSMDQKEQNNKLNEIAIGITAIKKDVCWIKNEK